MYRKLDNRLHHPEPERRVVLGEVQNLLEQSQGWHEIKNESVMTQTEMFYLIKGLHEKIDLLGTGLT